MSYNQPKKPMKSAKPFYPSYMMVNGNVVLTGPYRKEIAGDSLESVYMYLKHVEENYNKLKKHE